MHNKQFININYSFCCTSLENFLTSPTSIRLFKTVIILFLKTLDASTQNVKNIQDVKPHKDLLMHRLLFSENCTLCKGVHKDSETSVNGVMVQLMRLLNPGNNYAYL